MIKNNWKPQICNSNKEFPYLIIDNWYSKEEEKLVWKELDFLTSIGREKLARAEKTIVASLNGKPLGRSYRLYPFDIYNNNTIRTTSHIHRFLYKQRSKEFHDLLFKTMPHALSFTMTNRDSSLISYYENDDHYDEHIDMFNFTCLTWFHRSPKKYTGGDFYLPESKQIIESNHNRLLIFPSYYKHGVKKIKMKENLKIGWGRFTITTFYYILPNA